LPLIVLLGPLITPPWLRDIVLLFLSIAFAAAAYQFVENPIRSYGLRQTRMVALTAGIFGVWVAIAVATLGMPKLPVTMHAQAEEQVGKLRKAQNDRGEAYTHKCHLAYDDMNTSSSCVFGAAAHKPNVILFGDSHAVQ
jgi:hypothetical protein